MAPAAEVIMFGAHGNLTAKVMVSSPRFLSLRGEVCGEIDLWFKKAPAGAFRVKLSPTQAGERQPAGHR